MTGGNILSVCSISADVVIRLRLNRMAPCAIRSSICIARKTCDGSRLPLAQAAPGPNILFVAVLGLGFFPVQVASITTTPSVQASRLSLPGLAAVADTEAGVVPRSVARRVYDVFHAAAGW